jgi:hypothetical protein
MGEAAIERAICSPGAFCVVLKVLLFPFVW